MDASGEPAAKRARSDSAPPGVAHEREVLGRSITDALLQASSHVLKEYMPDVTTERQVVLLAVANMASTVVELIMPTIQSVIRDRLARATPAAPLPPAPVPPTAPPLQQLYNPALPASATLFALQQMLAPQGQAAPPPVTQPAPRVEPPVAPLPPPTRLTLPPPQPRSTPARPPPLQPPAVALTAGQLRLVIVNECPEGFGSWRPVEWRSSDRIHFPELYEGLSGWNLLWGANGAALRVELQDASGALVTSGAAAHAPVHVVLLQGAAAAGRPLAPHVVRKTGKGGREERLLECGAAYKLSGGSCTLHGLRVKTNSSGAMNNEFRLGCALPPGTEPRVVEAVSRPFRVKARRAEAIRKHHPREILLESEVWRLVHIKRDSRKVTQLRVLLAGRIPDDELARGPNVGHLVQHFTEAQWPTLLGIAEEQWVGEVLDHIKQARANSNEKAHADALRCAKAGGRVGDLHHHMDDDEEEDEADAAPGAGDFPYHIGRFDTGAPFEAAASALRAGAGRYAGAGSALIPADGQGVPNPVVAAAAFHQLVREVSRNPSLGLDLSFGREASWVEAPTALHGPAGAAVAAAMANAVAAAAMHANGHDDGSHGHGHGSVEMPEGLRQLSAAAERASSGPLAPPPAPALMFGSPPFGSPPSSQGQGQLAGLVATLMRQSSEAAAAAPQAAGMAELAESSRDLARSISAPSDSVAPGAGGATTQEELSTLLMLGSIVASVMRHSSGETGGDGFAGAEAA